MAKLQSGSNVYGNLTVQTFLTVTGNVIGGNVVTVGLITATGNVTGGNILTAGIMSSTGNAIHGNILTAGLISATSAITSAANITGGNITTAGLVTATGNITGGNILSAGIISTSGNIFGGGIRSTSSGTAPASPSVGDFWYNTTTNVQYRFTFDGTSYYWIDDFGASAGVNGTFNAITNGNSNVSINTANANITVGVAGTSNVVVWSSTGQYVTGIVSASGNVSGGNIVTSRLVISANSAVNTLVSVTDTAPQGTSSAFSIINSGNTISILPNISSGAFNSLQSNGDIAILTSGPTIGNVGFSIIPWSGTSSGIKMNTVANVTTITLAAATLSTTGNITGGIGNITIGNILTAGIMSSTGNAIHGNILTAGLVSATGNVTGGNILTAGIMSSTGNAIHGNILTAGLVTATGNITGGNIFTAGLLSITGTTTAAGGAIVGPWNLGATDISVAAIGGGAASSGRTLLGWNRSGGGGEFDIINNLDGGSVGGVSFYNWANSLANTTSLIFNVQGTTGNVTVYGNINNGQANGVGNIGNATTYFNTVFAKATSAQYADLAETYVADNSYAPGTLVIFGGADEITASTQSHDTRVAGVISTEPAYLMNSGAVGLPVALTGRVPCSVVGTIRKGDRLVASTIKGVATVLDSNKYLPGCIIGKSLEDYNSNLPGVIEVAIGRY